MNVFFVDRNPAVAAMMLCDKHVVKMVLETAQILSTICGGPYKPTHQRHPSVLWAETQPSWVYAHLKALLAEYTLRYGRTHKCAQVAEQLEPSIAARQATKWCDPPQCMPECYRGPDPVEAYRLYYIREKSSFAQWSRGRNAPDWYHPNPLQ